MKVNETYTPTYNQQALSIIQYSGSDPSIIQRLAQVKVAVIDEGITAQSLNFIKLRQYQSNELPSHGTVIANLLGANLDTNKGYKGLMPDLPLYGYSLSSDEMDTVGLIKAIKTAINWNVDIIAISMGTNKDNDDLENTVKDAVDHGIVVICSAGNDPYEENYPASFDIPGVISVGAIGNDYNILPYTNVSSKIDIYAPGENIVSLSSDNSEPIEYSGTSVAVPFITLACIYIKAYSPSLDPTEVESYLIQQTDVYLAKWRNEQREVCLLDMAQLMKSLNV